MYTAESFLAKLKPYVIADMQSSGILASLTAAQAFIESNKGNSGLTTGCNNLFGIKGKYNGQSGTYWTTEYYNGIKTRVQAAFRKYPSWAESIADHSAMFNRMDRYKNLRGCKDYHLACQYVKADGYATSPTYTATLIKTIETYRLYEWDSLVPQTDFKYVVGKTYTLHGNMHVRKTAGGEILPYSALTINAKLHAKRQSDGTAVLKSGTKVTCDAVQTNKTDNSIWIKIPSGWVCAVMNGTTYIS